MCLRRASRELTEVLLLDGLAVSPVKTTREIRLLAVLHLHKFVFRDSDSEDPPRNVHRDCLVRRNVRRKLGERVARDGLQDVVTAGLHDHVLATHALELNLVLNAGDGRPARLVADRR